jgi:hypothetical protein
MQITNKDSMKNYIATELGAPIINVELHDVHYENAIEKAIKKFHRYVAGEGSIYELGVFELEAGKMEYNLRSVDDTVAGIIGRGGNEAPSGAELEAVKQALSDGGWENSKINIESVIDVKLAQGLSNGGINDLFTPSHGWFYGGGANSLGMNPGNGISNGVYSGSSLTGAYNNGISTSSGTTGQISSGSNYSAMLPLSSYVMFKQNLANIERIFGDRIMSIWRPEAGILTLYGTPGTSGLALIRYYRREEAVYLYNNTLFQDLVVAYAGLKWGEILDKYSTTMAGGGTVNGSNIISQYQTKLDAAIENIKRESWQPMLRKG